VFMGRLAVFNEQNGTPLRRTPSLAFRDLNLAKLYGLVHERGGSSMVRAFRVHPVPPSLLCLSLTPCFYPTYARAHVGPEHCGNHSMCVQVPACHCVAIFITCRRSLVVVIGFC